MSYLAKTTGRLSFRKAAHHLHLWLGLMSGLVIFIVGLTGAVYVFEPELRDWTEPYRFTDARTAPYISPTQLQAQAEKVLNGLPARVIEFPAENRSAVVAHWDSDNYKLVYMNQYTGEILKVKNMKHDFLRKVIEGHTSLWIPRYGRLVVSSATLIFVLLLISGLILWWPKHFSVKALKNAFLFRKNANNARRIYDLHNVLGFYTLLIALIIACSGLVWGFEWFSNGLYRVTSGEKSTPEWWSVLHSDSRNIDSSAEICDKPVDVVWRMYEKDIRQNKSFASVSCIHNPSDVISLTISPDNATGRKALVMHFDQYKLHKINTDALTSKSWEASETAEKIRKANFDIHTGRIAGLPGRILAFFASLIVASLPVTGFLMWKRKRKKQR